MEAGLLVSSESPRAIVERIAALERLGPFGLGPPDAVRIRDRYLDTPALELAARRIALRVRTVDDEVLIALKEDSKPLPGGGVDRLELEGPASARNLAAIMDAIEERGVTPPGPLPGKVHGDPTPFLAEGGWVVVQERETLRRRRSVFGPGTEERVAELAVDSVLFRADGRRVCHHEVEIEAKDGARPDVVRELRDRLLGAFGGSLVPWDHAKLATGMAIQELGAAGELDALVGPEGDLRPEAYDRLTSWLRREEEREPSG